MWTIGEFGDLLVQAGSLVAAPLLEGEEPVVVTDTDVAALWEALMRDPGADVPLRGALVMAAAKLSQRCSADSAAQPRLKALVAKHSTSIAPELQQRSVELSALLVSPQGVQDAVLERMPAPDEALWKLRNLPEMAEPAPRRGSSATTAAAVPERATDARAAVETSKQSGVLNDLLGGLDGDSASQSTAAAAAALADMLGDTQGSAPAVELRGPYGTLGSPMTVYSRNGVTVVFQCAKPPGQEASVTQVTGIYSYEAQGAEGRDDVVESFILQAAVPKYMQLTMGPATGSTLRPGAAQAVTQGLVVANSLYGTKPLVMKVRLGYRLPGGEAVEEELTVADFPAGA